MDGNNNTPDAPLLEQDTKQYQTLPEDAATLYVTEEDYTTPKKNKKHHHHHHKKQDEAEAEDEEKEDAAKDEDKKKKDAEEHQHHQEEEEEEQDKPVRPRLPTRDQYRQRNMLVAVVALLQVFVSAAYAGVLLSGQTKHHDAVFDPKTYDIKTNLLDVAVLQFVLTVVVLGCIATGHKTPNVALNADGEEMLLRDKKKAENAEKNKNKEQQQQSSPANSPDPENRALINARDDDNEEQEDNNDNNDSSNNNGKESRNANKDDEIEDSDYHSGMAGARAYVVHHAAVFATLMMLSKLWIVGAWWSPQYAPSAAVFCVAIASGFLTMWLLRNVDDIDTPKSTKFKWLAIGRVLKPYVWPRGIRSKLAMIVMWLIVACGRVFNVLAPLFLGRAVSELSKGPGETDMKVVNVNLVLFTFMGLAPKMLLEVQELIAAKVFQAAFVEVAEMTFNHIHKLSVEWHLKKKLGQTARAIDRGQEGADTLMNWTILYSAPAVGSAVGAMFVMATVLDQAAVAAVAFAFFSVYVWATYLLVLVRAKLWEQVNARDNERSEKSTDSLINFEAVKHFCAEEEESRKYAQSVKEYQSFSFLARAANSAVNSAQALLLQLALLFALMISAATVYSSETGSNGDAKTGGVNSSKIGAFVAVQAYMVAIFEPLSYIGSIIEFSTSALIDMQNLADLLSEECDVKDVPNAPPLSLEPQADSAFGSSSVINNNASNVPSAIDSVAASTSAALGLGVEFKDVHFQYPSVKEALLKQRKKKANEAALLSGGGFVATNSPAAANAPFIQTAEEEAAAQRIGGGVFGVSFKVAPGTTTAIVGATGSAKSTLTKLLFRFYDIDTGTIIVNGQDVSQVQQRSLRRAIGIVSQDTTLFNDTLRENIRYGKPDATDEEVMRAAEQAQIADFIRRLPKKLDTVCGEQGKKLSGGEKQRVAVARALLKDAPIVVLDEATSALDNRTEREVQKALAALASRTQIVIAHRLSTIINAEQIIVMDKGKAVERGTHDELLQKPDGAYAAMWNAQLKSATAGTVAAAAAAADDESSSTSSSSADASPAPAATTPSTM